MYKNTIFPEESKTVQVENPSINQIPINKNMLDMAFFYLYHELNTIKNLLKKSINLEELYSDFIVDVYIFVDFVSEENSYIHSFVIIPEKDGDYYPDENSLKLFSLFLSIDPVVFFKQCNNLTKNTIYSQARSNFYKRNYQCNSYSLLCK